MKQYLCELTTYGRETFPVNAWNDHPRPQLKRDHFISLNGQWDLSTDSPGEEHKKILVPYPAESQLSGINKHFPEGTELEYSKQLPGIRFDKGEIVLLHIDAVDQEADIYINDIFVTHIVNFEGRAGIDITEFLSDNNILTIKIKDDLGRKEFPYGKQTLRRGGMWYTPFSGIWQSVWIEIVPKDHIKNISIRVSLFAAEIDIEGCESGTVLFENRELPFDGGHFTLIPEDPILWSPEDPHLYNFTVMAGGDKVHSYFALRTLSVENIDGVARLCLNGKPYFFHGLLDQGYWPDGITTPPSPSCFARDILALKELGFNTLRKHIKVEHEQFYYDCDRLGMIVFQDMVNNGNYSFFRDTILPTIGIKRINDSNLNKAPSVRKMFISSMQQTVEILKNHPSICCWTIFNEGWGQFEADKAYDILKGLDGSRFIDTASGWFHPKRSDVESLHVYFRKFHMPRSDKPVLLSEFGGYSCKIPGHSFNLKKTYGYRFFKDPAKYMDAIEKLYTEEIIPAAKAGLSGAIYTQVCDVEDETNGLLTYDRAICKADSFRMKQIALKLKHITE